MSSDADYRGSSAKTEALVNSLEVQIPVAPDGTTAQLVRIWQELLGISSISVSDNYFDLGGDSSLAVQLFSRIDEVFHVKLPLATLFDAPTIGELSRILRQEITSSSWSPLVPIQPNGSRPPLFCMHPHGGNVLLYRDLSRRLGPDQPFYGLQSPGMDGSCPPLSTIEDMAAVYVREIRKVQPHGPYFLGGYCMGGVLAFEMAQQLQAAREQIGLLALVDTVNSSEVPEWFWAKSIYLAERGLFHLENFLQLDLTGKAGFLREKLDSLRTRMPIWLSLLRKRPRGTSSESWVLGQIWHANFQACVDYLPVPYEGAVLDFRPAKQYRIYSKPHVKWDRLALGGQEVVVLPVNPPAMLIEPFVEHLAGALRNSIDRAIQSCEAQSA